MIDAAYEKGEISEARMAFFLSELSKAENRPADVGFYAGLPKFSAHLYGVNGAGVTQEFIASVLSYDASTQMATILVRNNFKPGCQAEVFGPHITNEPLIIGDCFDEMNEKIEVANKPMQIQTNHTGYHFRWRKMI